jgi:predicted aldo/keto reductase-like oxidoreductase
MQYREFGNTGFRISALGFGAMRLPFGDEQKSIAAMRRAFDLGVNYVDTAHGYGDGKSEILVGKALKGYRDKVMLSSKFPTWGKQNRSDYRTTLEEQLK